MRERARLSLCAALFGAAIIGTLALADRQVQLIRRSGKPDTLALSSATEQWLRHGYQQRMSTEAVRRDLGEILAHGEPEHGMGQGEAAEQPTEELTPGAVEAAGDTEKEAGDAGRESAASGNGVVLVGAKHATVHDNTNRNHVWPPVATVRGTTNEHPAGDVFCPLRFPGRYHDAGTQINYSYHRYYDPTTGGYHASDPIGIEGGPNPYKYVLNPTAWLDPLGLMSCPENLDFDNRTEAFNAARDRAGIPRSQQPSKQWTVGDNPSQQYRPNYTYDANPGARGRYYQYETPSGPRVIAEHTSDPMAKDPHFHAGQPKDPAIRDMQGERYQQVGGKHHYYYPG